MLVQLNDFRRQWLEIHEDVSRAVDRVGASGWYVLGAECRRFEEELAQFWGVAHAVGVGTGLDAIEISLRCLGLSAGDRVLTTPLSAFATTLAILRIGATPVFVDVDDRGLLDLERCRRALEDGAGIRFLLPVHLYGQSLDLQCLAELRDEFGLRVVEDCAQSIGASWRGTRTGTVGQMSATSFYPTKNLGALGDGGAVLTALPDHAARARALRDYGQRARYEHAYLGTNSRLDELQAAILSDAMLPRLADWTARRREVHARYSQALDNPRIEPLRTSEDSEAVWHLFPVLVAASARQAFCEHLEAHGVDTARHYPKLIPDQDAMRSYGRFEVLDPIVNGRRFADCEVSLPIHAFLGDEEIDRVVAACNTWDGR